MAAKAIASAMADPRTPQHRLARPVALIWAAGRLCVSWGLVRSPASAPGPAAASISGPLSHSAGLKGFVDPARGADPVKGCGLKPFVFKVLRSMKGLTGLKGPKIPALGYMCAQGVRGAFFIILCVGGDFSPFNPFGPVTINKIHIFQGLGREILWAMWRQSIP